ncbi:MAG: hypothetical protein PVJ55_01715 [Anaerolineae bacterium]|jgi:hypothetical protein
MEKLAALCVVLARRPRIAGEGLSLCVLLEDQPLGAGSITEEHQCAGGGHPARWAELAIHGFVAASVVNV